MEIAYLQSAGDGANSSSYTFSAQNFGTADANRYIIACFYTRSSSGTPTFGTVTIGGVTATKVVADDGNGTEDAAIYIAAVPTGTSGDVVVATSSNVLRMGLSLYRAVDIDSATATDTLTTNDSSSPQTNPTGTIDCDAGGFIIGAGFCRNATTATWTGITEDYEGFPEGTVDVGTTASDTFGSAQTGLTLAILFNSSGNAPPLVAASWAAAGGGGGTAVPVFAMHYRKLMTA